MKKRDYLLAIGVMTGNSLDGADAVLSKFDQNGIADLKSHSIKSPPQLTQSLRQLRKVINECHGNMEVAIANFDQQENGKQFFTSVHQKYIDFVATTIKELISLANTDEKLKKFDLNHIDLIGFHGQTCAHCPPSIAKTSDPNFVYTCQIGDGQLLADMTGITVVYDFRSDDLINGGEAAPLAPIHHQHLAESLKKQGCFPIAFLNGGNTGNISIISICQTTGKLATLGWDTGPFNNYPDKLMQLERNQSFDQAGLCGAQGKVNEDLLRLLFETAVVTTSSNNFLLQAPPKSSDPQWYKMIPELTGKAPVAGQILPLEDRLRTAEYFSAYIFMYALTQVPNNIQMPNYFALCGGGWKNPVVKKHFVALLQNVLTESPVLNCHQTAFAEVRERIINNKKEVYVEWSNHWGYDGTAMEARIFADAAVCRIKGEAFSKPNTTGVAKDTIAGIIRFPQGNIENATETLRHYLQQYNSLKLTLDEPQIFDPRTSRASAGWHQRLSQTGLLNNY